MRRAEFASLRAGAWAMGALPDGMGQFRVAHRYWRWRRPAHRVVAQRLVGGPRLLLDLGDRTQAIAYLTRRYSDDLVSAIALRLPGRDGVFLDVGANVGLITFQVAYRRPAARIHAFEANPAAAQSWRSNHRLNPSGRTTMEPVAVSSAPGAVTFRAPEADLGGGAVTRDGSGITVPATTLDAYCGVNGIDAIDVMKVDVEGSEPDVLDGARELLSAGAIRAVVMELNDGWLSARGLSRGDLIARLAEHRLLPAGPTTGGDVVFDLAAR